MSRHAIGGDNKRCVQMDVTLRHSARRVSKEACDRQLRKAEIARHAGECVSRNVGRHFLEV